MHNSYIRFLILVLFLTTYCVGTAQIEEVPIQYNPIVANAKKHKSKDRRASSLDTLPFVEDFAYAGPFPSTERWEDDHVFVNNTLAIDPPSIGVATFDGLDNTGSPYDRTDAGDTLTSVGINLDIPNVNNLFISYLVQAKGFGDAPESTDSLILEFKDSDGRWTEQRSYTGRDGFFPDSDVAFTFDAVQIAAQGFLFDDFQFRFRNTSSGNGAVDLWHLDLIRIYNNQTPTETYQDIAFQYPTQSILGRYSAMPVKHFENGTGNHLRDNFVFSIFNHFDVPRPIGSTNSELSIVELNTGTTLVAPEEFLNNVNDLNIEADTSKIIQADINIPSANFNNVLGEDELRIEATFTIDPNPNDNDPGLLENNVMSRITYLQDYFAYDDGSAESGIQASGSGTQVAVEFQTSVSDTLSAIQLNFPHIVGDVTSQFFNLKVWLDDLESEPVFNGQLLGTVYPDDFVDTLQGFTSYKLQETFTGELEPVILQANQTFFIGWEQVTSATTEAIPVGFDKTSPEATPYNFFKGPNDAGWTNFSTTPFSGAVMIRPVMGAENAINTSTENLNADSYSVFPNPSDGILNIKGDKLKNLNLLLNVFDIQGHLVHSGEMTSNSVDLRFLPNGIYLINLSDQDKKIMHSEKLIIQSK